MSAEDIKQYEFTSDQSRTKAAEAGRSGGIASGEARRAKKLAKQIAVELLDGEIKNQAGEVATRRLAVLAAQMNKAQKGDLKATQFLLELADEYKADGVNINVGATMSKEEAYNIIYGE